ncbi:MAG: maleylpyruvate isomerase N-terminal domain-containing protein [Pseudonocardiaceae bacterium]
MIGHSCLVGDIYQCRLDALEQTWGIWGRIGKELTEEQWSRPSRCSGWDVAALYGHYSRFPLGMSTPPSAADDPDRELLTAVELMKRFQSPDGVAQAAAGLVADGAVAEAAAHTWQELVDRFVVHGPRALKVLRLTEPTLVVRWPMSDYLITVVEGLRVALLEATVHLLDVQRALDHPPEVPLEALRDTVRLLAGIAPPVEFIEAATGRSTQSPFPVLR